MPDEQPQVLETTKPRMTNVTQAAKDAANMRLFKGVKARVIERVKQIEEDSTAHHESVDIGEERQWITTPPKMFIAKLNPTIQNGVGIITYYKYATRINKKTGELEKAPSTQKRDHPFKPGEEIDHQVIYPYSCIVKETIEFGKPIKIEETNFGELKLDPQ